MPKLHSELLNQRESRGRNYKIVSTGVFNFTVLIKKTIGLEGKI